MTLSRPYGDASRAAGDQTPAQQGDLGGDAAPRLCISSPEIPGEGSRHASFNTRPTRGDSLPA